MMVLTERQKSRGRIALRKIWAYIRKDDFRKLEAELQDVLLLGWDATTKEAINDVIRALTGDSELSESDLEKMLAALELRLGVKFAGRVAAPLVQIQTSAYAIGMEDIIQVKPTFSKVDYAALDMLERHNTYWMRNYYDKQIAGTVRDMGRVALRAGLTRREAGLLFQEAFQNQINQGIRYWEGFAAHVITRSRELGRVEGYVQAGIEAYEVRAVLDRRTTPICREMHGRIIRIEEAVKLRDALLEAKDPEQVKQIAPWLKPEQVQGKKTAKLPTGMALPPYHFKCRTRTVKHRGTSAKNTVVEMEAGKKTPEVLLGRSADEYTNLLRDIRARKLRFNKKDLAHDSIKHMQKFKRIKTVDEYVNAARNVVKTSDKILVQWYKNRELQYLFFGSDGIVTVDMAMEIRGYYFHQADYIERTFQNLLREKIWLKTLKS